MVRNNTKTNSYKSNNVFVGIKMNKENFTGCVSVEDKCKHRNEQFINSYERLGRVSVGN